MPVALSGRVPVKVSANSEIINPGDFVATSAEQGKATKATQKGYVIGKAIEGWLPGQETVMVFVNNTWFEPGLADGEIPDLVRDDIVGVQDDIARLEERIELLELDSGVTSIATSSADLSTSLEMTDLVISGDTVLGDVTVTGVAQIGSMIIDGFANSIDSVGVLQIQPMALGNIELMAGKVEIDTEGNININEGHIAGNASFRDSLDIAEGESSVRIEREWEATPQTITATPNWNANIWITDRDETGFIINFSEPSPVDAKIDWLAIW